MTTYVHVDDAFMRDLAHTLGKPMTQKAMSSAALEAIALYRWVIEQRRHGLEVVSVKNGVPHERVETPLLYQRFRRNR